VTRGVVWTLLDGFVLLDRVNSVGDVFQRVRYR
jgi:hypothetical protein